MFAAQHVYRRDNQYALRGNNARAFAPLRMFYGDGRLVQRSAQRATRAAASVSHAQQA